MEPKSVTEHRLAQVLADLQRREPVFHRPEIGTSRHDFENMTDGGFWEVGASGQIYSREYVIDTLVRRHSTPHNDIWKTSDFRCRELSPDTYLLTYQLVQDETRTTRRCTLWRKTHEGWKILYHQGTLVGAP